LGAGIHLTREERKMLARTNTREKLKMRREEKEEGKHRVLCFQPGEGKGVKTIAMAGESSSELQAPRGEGRKRGKLGEKERGDALNTLPEKRA